MLIDILRYIFFFPILKTGASALALSTTFSAPEPTLARRDATTSTTSAIDFMTTEYITIPGQTNEHVTIAAQTINIAIPTCIHTITPDKNGFVPAGSCGALYNYYPSFAAALAFSVIFGVLTVAHIAQAWRFKTSFCWVIIMGALWQTGGYVTRTISTRNQQSAGLALVSQIFILLAPLWVNAFAYMLMARMIHYYGVTPFSIPASALSILFVMLDIVSFVVQLVGGSYAGPTAPMDQQLKGVHIYMGGIGLQQFFIFVFLGFAVKFHLGMASLERLGHAKYGWKKLLWTLYGSLGFITVRIFFRLIEFSAGTTSSNPLPFHEAYFYALESVPMSFAILCFNVTHPGSILQGPDAQLPTIRSLISRARRSRKDMAGLGFAVEDGEELVSRRKYMEIAEKD